MDGGRIVTEGSPRELVARHATREVVELRFTTPEARDAALPAPGRVRRAGRGADRPSARVHARRRRRSSAWSATASCSPSRCTNGVARSRTSSSSSPAARSRTDVATPRRAAGRREGMAGVAPPLEGVGVPGDDLAAAVPGRDGTRARRSRQQGLGRQSNGVDYLVFVTPGLDGRERHDAGGGGVALAGARRGQVDAHVPRGGGDAGQRRRALRRARAVDLPARPPVGVGVPRGGDDPRRRAVVVGCARDPGCGAGRVGVRGRAERRTR